MSQKTRSQNYPASSSTSPLALSSGGPRRPGKDKVTEPNEIDVVQMNNRQAQLEEAVGVMSQGITREVVCSTSPNDNKG